MKAPAAAVLIFCALALQTGGISSGAERLFASGLKGPSIARSPDGRASSGGMEFWNKWLQSPPLPQLRGGGPSFPVEQVVRLLQCGGCPRGIGSESARQVLRGGGRTNEKLVMEAFPKDVSGMIDPLKGEVAAPPRP